MGFSGSWVGHLWISSRVEAIKSGIKLLCDFFKAIETVEAVLQRTAEKYTKCLPQVMIVLPLWSPCVMFPLRLPHAYVLCPIFTSH